ncbi:hypothetical protein R3W88_016275 [Solanum pinnatisectum]|uniref:Protein FAR1-RELATED SEQUENCE n=1 Tax=Solanum pinnatisectum TaxID=50273 RepID=A0AAV9KWY4_9SOLN|nr:hypothetical protein R3W88_016275 [Solanum pinnatisectum]
MSKKEEEKWLIARLVSNHNHELASPNKAQKNHIDFLNNSGIHPSKCHTPTLGEADKYTCFTMINNKGNISTCERMTYMMEQTIEASWQDMGKLYIQHINICTIVLYRMDKWTHMTISTHIKLLQLCKELYELPYKDVNDNVCDRQVNESNLDLNSSEQRENFSLLDPPCVATKGRPRSVRMKGVICLICSSHTNVEEEFNSRETFLNADPTMVSEFSAYSEPFQGQIGRADSYPTSFMSNFVSISKRCLFILQYKSTSGVLIYSYFFYRSTYRQMHQECLYRPLTWVS